MGSPRTAPGDRGAPLGDIRVLDLSSGVAGPFCTRLFAEYGAYVVKVEAPDGGDRSRRMGPFPGGREDPEESGAFKYLNGGKRSIALDLDTAQGRNLIRRLVRECDILVEDLGAARMAELGLAYEDLRRRQPGLVMCSVSNFGATGPYRDYRATELTFQALSGFMAGAGNPGAEPLWIPLDVAQQVAGVYAYIYALAAEEGARVTGDGAHLDMSVLEGFLETQELMLTAYKYCGYVRARTGDRRSTNHPAGIMRCKDGYVQILTMLPQDFPALMNLIGRPDLATDPRLATGVQRAKLADEIDAAMEPWLMSHTAEEIYRLCQDVKFPAAPVADSLAMLASPQLLHRGYFVQGPDGGPVQPRGPFPWTGDEEVDRRAPRLGEHGREVLAELLGDAVLEGGA